MNSLSKIFLLQIIVISLCLSVLANFGLGEIPEAHADSINSGINFFTDAEDISLGSTGSYIDIDLSSYLPTGSTGVIIEVVNTDSSNHNFGIREAGSSDDWYNTIFATFHTYLWFGVNSTYYIQGKIDSTDIDFFLLGYTSDCVTFFTDAIDYSTGTTGSYVDTDLSANVPSGATGVILLVESSGTYNVAVRHPDSTDDHYGRVRTMPQTYITGINSSRMIQQKIENVGVDVHLLGYFESPIVFKTDFDALGVATTGVWTNDDITGETSSDATGAIIMLKNTSGGGYYEASVRADGSTDDRSSSSVMDVSNPCIFAGVELDSGQIFEYWIEHVDVDLYVVGYTEEIPQSYVYPDHVEDSFLCTDPNNSTLDDGYVANLDQNGWIVWDFGSEIANVTEIHIDMEHLVSGAYWTIERSTDEIDWYETMRIGSTVSLNDVQTMRYDSEVHGRFRYLRITSTWHVFNNYTIDFIGLYVQPPAITYDDGTYVYPNYLYYFDWGYGSFNYMSRPYNVLGENQTSLNPTASMLNYTTRLVNTDYDEDNYLIVRFSDYYNITSVGMHFTSFVSNHHTYMYIGDSLNNLTLVYDYYGAYSGWGEVAINYTRLRYIYVNSTGLSSNYIVVESFRIQGSVHTGTGGTEGGTEGYEWTFFYFPHWLADGLGISLFAGQLLASSCVLACFLLPFAFYERRSYWATIIVGIVVLAFLVAVGWLPTWIMLILILIVAGLFGKRFSEWFTGR